MHLKSTIHGQFESNADSHHQQARALPAGKESPIHRRERDQIHRSALRTQVHWRETEEWGQQVMSLRFTDERGTKGNESPIHRWGTKYTKVHWGPRYTERDWGVRTCHWQFATRTGPVLLLSAIPPLNSSIGRGVLSSTFNWRRQRTEGAVA